MAKKKLRGLDKKHISFRAIEIDTDRASNNIGLYDLGAKGLSAKNKNNSLRKNRLFRKESAYITR